jgi:hypothetical protein
MWDWDPHGCEIKRRVASPGVTARELYTAVQLCRVVATQVGVLRGRDHRDGVLGACKQCLVTCKTSMNLCLSECITNLQMS